MNVGPIEIVIVLVLALLVFGPKRLPQMGRTLGKGVREFKNAASTARTELGLDEVASEISSVKDTVVDLKSTVDLKAAIESPTGAAAGSGTAVTAGAAAAAAANADVTPPAEPPAATEPASAQASDSGASAAPAPEAPEIPDAPGESSAGKLEAPDAPAEVVPFPTSGSASAT